MYYKTSRTITNALFVLGFLLCLATVRLGVFSFVLGVVSFGAAVYVHRKYGVCPSCGKHVPPTLGQNHCPHCGERLL